MKVFKPLSDFKNRTVFIFAMLLLVQCTAPTEKTETPSKTIFTNFYVRYLQSEQQLKGQITFGEGDAVNNTQPVAMKKVNFMNSGMSNKDVQGKFSRFIYQAKTPNILSSFNFNYTDSEDKSYEQILEMTPVDNFSIPTGCSKTNGMVLQLEGESAKLTEDESLVLLFSDKDNKVTTLEVEGPSTRPAITFAGDQLKDLSLGKNKLYVVKKQNRQFKKDHYDITTTIEFYSDTIEVEVSK